MAVGRGIGGKTNALDDGRSGSICRASLLGTLLAVCELVDKLLFERVRREMEEAPMGGAVAFGESGKEAACEDLVAGSCSSSNVGISMLMIPPVDHMSREVALNFAVARLVSHRSSSEANERENIGVVPLGIPGPSGGRPVVALREGLVLAVSSPETRGLELGFVDVTS
jgi:hypothetical protein